MDETVSALFLKAQQDGDHEQARALLGRLSPEIRAYVERRAGRFGGLLVSARLEPNEVAQVVLGRLLERGPTETSATSSAGRLLAFADVVALNVVRSAARKHQRERLDPGRDDDEPHHEPVASGSADQVERQMDATRVVGALRRCIDGLSDRFRALALALADEPSLSTDELAVRLGEIAPEALEALRRESDEGRRELQRMRLRVDAWKSRARGELYRCLAHCVGEDTLVTYLHGAKRGRSGR